jgi:ribosomal protein S18 acetylase RimI-like enzyme
VTAHVETVTALDDATIAALVALLIDSADSGASTSFLPPLASADAETFWRRQLPLAPRGAIFLARADGHDGAIDGCVMLVPAWAPNQPHRAEVAKLIVHRRARRRGLGRQLMTALEGHARAAGFTLLTLDTIQGDAAEALYRDLGWIEVGAIPGYSINAGGDSSATVIFYKSLA